jgi:putative transcriptional regulator
MKKRDFEDLVASVRQAGEIRRGKRQASRVFEFKPESLRRVRERLKKSQAAFASMIGVSVATLRNWEQGRRMPEGPARALLAVASKYPDAVADALGR